jgi:hypothetical protein
MTSRKRQPEKNSANAEGFTDAVYENPPANLSNLPPDIVEQYIDGYEEGRIEKSEKWLIDYDN